MTRKRGKKGRAAAAAPARSLDEETLLAGSLTHMPLPDLLQIMALNEKDADVELQRGTRQGRIVIDGGRLVHAESGRAFGRKALYRMLGWHEGRFRVWPLEQPPERRTLEAKASDAVMDGLFSLDEWNRRRASLPDPLARLEFVAETGEQVEPQPASPAESDVLAQLEKGLRVGEILEESPFPDAELAKAICTLMDRGVVRPVAV